MTKIIRTLTELISMHAIGLALTNLVGWWIVHQLTGQPIPKLMHAFFLERGWVYGTLLYAVLIQWYVWRFYLERPRPKPRQPKPRLTLALMYPPNPDTPKPRRSEWVPPRPGRLQDLKMPRLTWNQIQGIERNLNEETDADGEMNTGRGTPKILN